MTRLTTEYLPRLSLSTEAQIGGAWDLFCTGKSGFDSIRGVMPYKDKSSPVAMESLRAARLKHYENNKDEYKARAIKRREEIRHFLVDYKESRSCADCHKRFPHYVLDLDHLPGCTKLIGPASLPNLGSWKKVHEELAKCEVVCANCHRQRTYFRNLD